MPAPIKISDFKEDLEAFLSDYTYQRELTSCLDKLEGAVLTDELLNKIVL